MAIAVDDVREIAKLARLIFTPEEEKKLTQELQQIITYFQQIDELNTDDIPPCSNITSHQNQFREDICQSGQNQEELLTNTPAKFAGFFRVPKVIKLQKKIK